MVILNLYPKGTLEYNNKEIRSTGINNKAAIPIGNIINIEFIEPTFIKNGKIKIQASNLNGEIECIFRKNQLDNAKIAYSEIMEMKNNYQEEISNIDHPIQDNYVTNNNTNYTFINEFKCTIREERSGFTVNERSRNLQNAIVTLDEDSLIIKKESFWRNKDRGDKEILYVDITSVDLDLAGTLGVYNFIEITLSGSDVVILENTNKEITQNFFNSIKEKVREKKISNNQSQQASTTITQATDADELMKWHQMMEQGIITKEEFEHKKKEILGL